MPPPRAEFPSIGVLLNAIVTGRLPPYCSPCYFPFNCTKVHCVLSLLSALGPPRGFYLASDPPHSPKTRPAQGTRPPTPK
ncbi:hypothetical protein XENTR_v10015404 [Xenopus tropicalis]|nr:hypothetical protein XENTR_v10015404 [Xenopus tropicalis]